MRNLCCVSKTPSYSMVRDEYSPSRASLSTITTPRHSFSDLSIEQTIERAEEIITKWNPDSSTFAKVTSLFYESKLEAMGFVQCVNDLQKVMGLLISQEIESDTKLAKAQNLMRMAMKRLQKEFYQILSMNRAQLDPESVSTRSSRISARSISSDDDHDSDSDSIVEVEEVSSVVMMNLRSIAECMIGSGYAKDCVDIYKLIRKSIINEGIYRLGVEKLSASKLNKLDSEVLEFKIENWLEAMKMAISTLFVGEKILCDNVFVSSRTIRDSTFNEILKEGATLLLQFPQLVVKNKKFLSPEKIFRLLDMYTAIAKHWQEIESIFSPVSASDVRSTALNSLIQLSQSVRLLLADFQSSIQKNSSKLLVPGGGLHPLTVSSMSYLSLLADYSNVLEDIGANSPLQPENTLLPKSYFQISTSDDFPVPVTSHLTAKLILFVLCKLDDKSKHYKNVSLSYLFLANNLQHIVNGVRTSNLKYLLGEDWIVKQEAKLRQFAANYERLAWGSVYESLPHTVTNSTEEAEDWFSKFNSSFESAYVRNSSCVIPDTQLRNEMKVSIAKKIIPIYRIFYIKHRLMVTEKEKDLRSVGKFVRFTPEDVGNYLSDLYTGASTSTDGSNSTEFFSSSASARTSTSSNAMFSFRI